MQFLRTLFWVVVAIAVVLFSKANWHSVTLRLWGGLEADVKIPVILFIGFLVGFLPTFVIYRARIWSLKRRMEPLERNVAIHSVPAPQPVTDTAPAERVATDSKAWPSS